MLFVWPYVGEESAVSFPCMCVFFFTFKGISSDYDYFLSCVLHMQWWTIHILYCYIK